MKGKQPLEAEHIGVRLCDCCEVCHVMVVEFFDKHDRVFATGRIDGLQASRIADYLMRLSARYLATCEVQTPPALQ